MQAVLGHTSERRWLRFARKHLIGMLGADTSIATDDVWVVDSTPIEGARSRETVKRSDLAGWAEYGYCASHSRFFWGLRLHLVCILHGLPVGWALTGAKVDERAVLEDILANTPGVTNRHMEGRQILIGDKNYFGHDFETRLDAGGIELLRPARKGEKPRPGTRFFKPLRQVIESINWTYKGHRDVERHGGRTIAGVCTRVTQRVLALTATIWHNDNLGLDIRRSLTAYDH